MCVELYRWSIELEEIFVLPLAPRWVRHSYLSKEATIDPLYLWVINHHRHHAVVLTKLSLGLNWIKSTRDVTELNVCRSRRCRTFGTWSVGSQRRSTTSTVFHNSSAFGLRGYVDILSPLVAMHLLDRSCVILGNFLKYCVPQQWHPSQVYA